MADGYRFDILEKRAERKAHLDDIGVATLPDQPGKRGYSAAESRMHFKAPVDYLFSLLCGCMEEVGSEFDGYAPLSGADFTGDVTIGGSLSVSGGIACDGSSVLFEKDISELRATVAKHEDNLYAYISHSDEEGALVATEIIKGVSPDKGDDSDALATTEWTNGAIAEEASVREAKDDDLEASIEALRKDFDDLKSIVYGIHSLTYNSHEFSYLTSSIIPDEVDGRKVVGGSYAIMDWVGGNSFVYNQLCSNATASQTINGVTFTNNGDGSYTVNGTASANTYKSVQSPMTALANHKYLIKGAPSGSNYETYALVDTYSGLGGYVGEDGKIITTSSDKVFQLGIFVKEGVTVNNKVFRANLFDLTLSGIDNVTTVEEAKAELLKRGVNVDEYNDFNEGEIKSTIVSKIESWGANLFDKNTEVGTLSDFDKTTPRTFEDGKYYLGMTMNNYYQTNRVSDYSISENGVTVSVTQIGYGVAKAFKCDPNTDYSISFSVNSTSTSNELFALAYYDADGNILSYQSYTTSSITFTTPSNCHWVTLLFRPDANVKVTYSDIMLVRGSTAMDYKPYIGKLGEINIPNAPLKLDGVNDIHNTLTFEEQSDGSYNAILTRNIDIVDLGTLNWNKSGSTDSGNQRFISTTLQKSMPVIASNQSLSNVLSKDYATATQFDIWKATKDKTIGIYPSGTNCWLLIVDNDYADKTEQELKASLSGKKMLYATTTPTSEVIATGLTFDQVATLFEKGGTIKAVYEEVPPTASVDFMTKGE